MALPKVFIITATTASPDLITNIQSVQAQDYPNLEHVLVCDGKELPASFLPSQPVHPIQTILLPWNTGRDRFICHKIYASIPHLLHEPCLVSYLDEDNSLAPNHVSSLVATLQAHSYDWVYCLRNIVGPRNNLICRDICESLGNLSPTWPSLYQGGTDHLVDTSCYLVPVQILRQFSECWQRQARTQPEADRLFFQQLSRAYPHYGCSGKFTVNYKIENRPDSVKADFFMMGNSYMRARYEGDVPWDRGAV